MDRKYRAEKDRAQAEMRTVKDRAQAEMRTVKDRAKADMRAVQQREETIRTQAARDRERYKTARDAYRLAETRFELSRLTGQLREFICVLRQPTAVETVEAITALLLSNFESAKSHVDRYDPRLGSLLATRRRDLQLVLGHPQRGSSASTADEDAAVVVAALRSIALQTLAGLDGWIKEHQPRAPVD
jgi:hypothetical protein